MRIQTFVEQPGAGRLGRHVEHDPRSKSFPAPRATTLKTVRHQRNVPIFDQGQLGSCTGNAAVGMWSTQKFQGQGDEAMAVSVYSEATHIDGIPSAYPPDDTGSSGLAVMRTLFARKLIKGYCHAFGLDHVLASLVNAPGITGITWLTGCDSPDANGVVSYSGTVRGGHEIELIGLDLDASAEGGGLVWFANSWGTGWGLNGYFAMTFADYGKALADNGDATFASWLP
jgi:hypothetical protein